MLEQEFSNLPKLAFNPNARLWNAPTLEYFSFGAVFDEAVPAGLAEAQGLRGLSCAIAANAAAAALAVLPQFQRLEVLTLGYGSELSGHDLAALQHALPGVYIRVLSDAPFDLEKDDRNALCRKLSGHMYQQQHAEAAVVADQLFGLIDLDRPGLPAGLLEAAMQNRVRALGYWRSTRPTQRRGGE